jgi:hypothetical protein
MCIIAALANPARVQILIFCDWCAACSMAGEEDKTVGPNRAETMAGHRTLGIEEEGVGWFDYTDSGLAPNAGWL